jgi:hypoxanthine phosphoribosyltransferase
MKCKKLFSAWSIRSRVKKLGKQISKDYDEKGVIVVPVLEGGAMFAMDLIRELTIPITVQSTRASSYKGGTTSTGKVDVEGTLNVKDKNVLLVDDIYDTGLTFQTIIKKLKDLGANEIKTCVLLNKEVPRESSIEPDYYCFKIQDQFVIGYGLDYQGYYRNLPYIGILK